MLTGSGPTRVQAFMFYSLCPSEKWFPSVASLGFYTFLSPHPPTQTPSPYSVTLCFQLWNAATASLSALSENHCGQGFPAYMMTGPTRKFRKFDELSFFFFSINCKLLLYHLPWFRMPNLATWSYPMQSFFCYFFNHSNCKLYQGKLYWRPDHTTKYPEPFWREKLNYSHRIGLCVFVYPGNAQEVHRAFTLFYFS